MSQFYKANKNCLLNLDQADFVVVRDLEAYNDSGLDRCVVEVCFGRGKPGTSLQKLNSEKVEQCKVGTRLACQRFADDFSRAMEQRWREDYDKFYRPKEQQTMKNHMIKASADILLNLYNVISIKVEESDSDYAVNAYLTEQEQPELLHSGTLKECQRFLDGAYTGIREREQEQMQGLRGPAGLNAA